MILLVCSPEDDEAEPYNDRSVVELVEDDVKSASVWTGKIVMARMSNTLATPTKIIPRKARSLGAKILWRRDFS